MLSAASLETKAAELGFLAVGVATLEPSDRAEALDQWLAAGYAGTMRYLHRQAAKRKRPADIVPGAIRAVMVLDNYLPPAGPDVPGVQIAKYAQGRDYHAECGERLDQLGGWLLDQGATIARRFVDAGPVPERELANRAGLGWIGKNTMLIRPGAGSMFFIGAVFTDLALAPSEPFTADHCGRCTRCLDACPTEAILAPYQLDATRCISYLTIEYRGEVSDELARQFNGWAFGCDICNDVCPWNVRFAKPTERTSYHDRRAIDRSDAEFFARMPESTFADRFTDTPLERPGLEGMRRNYRLAFASLDPTTPP